jgi:hypothetical protein
LESALDDPVPEHGGCRTRWAPDRVLSCRAFDISFGNGQAQTTDQINDRNGETITKGRSRC